MYLQSRVRLMDGVIVNQVPNLTSKSPMISEIQCHQYLLPGWKCISIVKYTLNYNKTFFAWRTPKVNLVVVVFVRKVYFLALVRENQLSARKTTPTRLSVYSEQKKSFESHAKGILIRERVATWSETTRGTSARLGPRRDSRLR